MIALITGFSYSEKRCHIVEKKFLFIRVWAKEISYYLILMLIKLNSMNSQTWLFVDTLCLEVLCIFHCFQIDCVTEQIHSVEQQMAHTKITYKKAIFYLHVRLCNYFCYANSASRQIFILYNDNGGIIHILEA